MGPVRALVCSPGEKAGIDLKRHPPIFNLVTGRSLMYIYAKKQQSYQSYFSRVSPLEKEDPLWGPEGLEGRNGDEELLNLFMPKNFKVINPTWVVY